MTEKKKDTPKAGMNPYIFTALLFFFGSWCFYDGWLTTDPEMQEHLLFNRVLSFVLLPWSVWDFFKVRKVIKAKKEKEKIRSSEKKSGELNEVKNK